MSDESDFEEFVRLTDRFEKPSRVGRSVFPTSAEEPIESKDRIVSPGQPTQYALFDDGYKPTTSTVRFLPSGSYVVNVSQHGPYVSPMPEPSGLLLELPEMRSDDIIKLVQNFWDSEKDYKEGNEFVIGGAIFKQGLLIYGPPGSGKSCTLKILSKKLIEREGLVFYSSVHPMHLGNFLSDFSKIETQRKIIVILEDIDSQIEQFGESNFLEVLDSAKTIDNVLFVATTNYPERLDPRIYNRPGRFANVVKVGYPTIKAREAYLKAILKNHKDIPYIVEHSDGFTVDHLSSLVNSVYREKKELKSEIERLRTLFKVPKANESLKIGF